MPVVRTDDRESAHGFYAGFLGFRVAMEEDGMAMFVSPTVPTTQVLATWPSRTAHDPAGRRVDLSVEVADVDAAHAQAQADGLEIVYPLTDEAWGVRRFFVRDPGGSIVNVASHVADLPPAA